VNFTGIDSPYEPPEAPELHLDASGTGTVDDAAAVVIAHLRDTGILSPPENAAAT
jgi:bifunctional enzyme CysN/CysC